MEEPTSPAPVLDNDEWKATVPDLRARLLSTQEELREAQVPTVFIMSGADGVKSQTVNRLVSWFDPRGLDVETLEPNDERILGRPRMWLFVTTLPARGRIGLYFGSWYRAIVRGRVDKTVGKPAMRERLARLDRLERALVADGYLVVKAWFELTEDEQRERLERLSADPDQQWRVLPQDWRRLKHYKRFRKVRSKVMKHANAPGAEWHTIRAADDHWREVAVAEHFLERARALLDGRGRERTGVSVVEEPPPVDDSVSVLDSVDLTETLDNDAYEDAMATERRRMRDVSLAMPRAGLSSVLVFEGWDAAGKGGTIRRLTAPMDARTYRVVPIGAPTDVERQHHYLWRFWQSVPRAGRMTIYDRSWYGRVLVERVEALATEEAWRRAYGEIADFEDELAGNGIVVCKFWLHLSPEEQLRRFEDRARTPHKQYKLTSDDWRNREQRADYERAVEEMYRETHRDNSAPWFIIPSEDKRVARVRVLRTVADRLESALG